MSDRLREIRELVSELQANKRDAFIVAAFADLAPAHIEYLLSELDRVKKFSEDVSVEHDRILEDKIRLITKLNLRDKMLGVAEATLKQMCVDGLCGQPNHETCHLCEIATEALSQLRAMRRKEEQR